MTRIRSTASWTSIAAGALLFAGCMPHPPVTDQAKIDRKIAVRTVAVTATEVQHSTMQPASVYAFYRSEIYAKAAGYVGKISVDIGDVVQAGDELVRIEVPEMMKQREIIEARVSRLVAGERRVSAGVNLADAEVRAAVAALAESKSQMSRADAMLAAAEAEFNRTSDLVKRGSLQNRMLDEVRKRRDSERAGKEAVTSLIDSATANVAVSEAKKVAAQADLEAAKMETIVARKQLEELEVMIDYATVKAPISGIITQRGVEPGNLVGQSNDQSFTDPLFVISQIDKLRVHIPVPESDAPRVKPGDKVTLTFPSFSGEPAITTSVTRCSGSLDPSTRTMLVEVELDNPNGKLLPGMFGQALINLSTKVAANMLPARSIRFSDDGEAYVYVVDQDDTVSVASIQIGMDDGKSIEIRSGLQPGQRVIDAHLKRFVDGQKVAVLTN